MIYRLMSERGDTDAVQPVYRTELELNGHRLIVNPGSVGQPRDSNPDAAYSLLDVEKAVWEHRRIPYPIAKTQEKMRYADLPERLIVRLEHGW